ncbi:MAG: peptidase prolyl oligopeptidase active site domain protein [Acidimicrobiales bacterium]|nr:peptidase prolyl oligopeptidase active site domain protein [Acidimicrobiales bacterium]
MAPDAEPRERRPHGSWPSPITAATLVATASAVGEIRVDGEDVWWSESRPSEGGRTQLVRGRPDGTRVDLFATPESAARTWNARTQVHEYGGGAWSVRGGVVVFADWGDQRLYRVADGAQPVAITPEPTTPRGLRWADLVAIDDDWLVCVRESHEPAAVEAHGEAVNELVAVPLDGSAVDDPGRVRVLVSGPDFVAGPAVADDTLAWIQWDHPRMPWDGTELWTATLVGAADGPVALEAAQPVAGGPSESVVQPLFVGDHLIYCSDRTGWWNPWRVGADGPEPLIAGGVEAEIGGAQWVFGLRWLAPLADGRLACSITRSGLTGLAVIEPDGRLVEATAGFTAVEQVVAQGDEAIVVAAPPDGELRPYRCRIAADGTTELELLRPGRDLGIEPAWFSVPEPIEFASTAGRRAHALYYPPTNPEVQGAEGELPPLLVLSHGGPTSAARARLDLGRQFWTSRGFAVVDVNYGGSTGYGRPYRRLLDGAWGIVDVEDCIAAARHLAAAGLADPERLAIRGGSAGGYTTLAALAFHDAFAAGASHYGVADLEALARETHKFESRYLDGLVGPYPEARDVYVARSPIHHAEGLSCPLIVLQGLEDEVVPPNQAEMMIAALAARGVPHAYVPFPGEQHGFRRSESIVRALEAELWFYGRVFGFEPADRIEPVDGAVGLD